MNIDGIEGKEYGRGMDVGKDLSVPRGDLKREDETGKYIYKINQDRFEVDKWKRDFEQYKERREKIKEQKMRKRLDELNRPEPTTPVYNLPLGKILINTKDSLFDILDDALQFNFSSEMVLKDNRLFYIGLAMIIIAIVTYLFMMFF